MCTEKEHRRRQWLIGILCSVIFFIVGGFIAPLVKDRIGVERSIALLEERTRAASQTNNDIQSDINAIKKDVSELQRDVAIIKQQLRMR